MSASWQKDPLGRAELRYYDGNAWTLDVSSGGVQSREPEGTSLAASSAVTSTSGSSGSSGSGGAGQTPYGQNPYGQVPAQQTPYGSPAYPQQGGYVQPTNDGGRGRLLAAGILSIVSGVVWLFSSILVLSVLNSDAGGFVDDVFGGAITILFVFLLLLGAAFIAAGWGACAGKAWGQIAVIVLGGIGVLLWLYALVMDGGAGSLIPIIWFGAHVGLAVSAKPASFNNRTA